MQMKWVDDRDIISFKDLHTPAVQFGYLPTVQAFYDAIKLQMFRIPDMVQYEYSYCIFVSHP